MDRSSIIYIAYCFIKRERDLSSVKWNQSLLTIICNDYILPHFYDYYTVWAYIKCANIRLIAWLDCSSKLLFKEKLWLTFYAIDDSVSGRCSIYKVINGISPCICAKCLDFPRNLSNFNLDIFEFDVRFSRIFLYRWWYK